MDVTTWKSWTWRHKLVEGQQGRGVGWLSVMGVGCWETEWETQVGTRPAGPRCKVVVCHRHWQVGDRGVGITGWYAASRTFVGVTGDGQELETRCGTRPAGPGSD